MSEDKFEIGEPINLGDTISFWVGGQHDPATDYLDRGVVLDLSIFRVLVRADGDDEPFWIELAWVEAIMR